MRKHAHIPFLPDKSIVAMLLVVFIACGLLGYFGLQAIERENEGQRILTRQNLRNVLSLAVREIENHILDRTEELLNTVAAHVSSYHVDSLHALSQKEKMIESVFLVDHHGWLTFPRSFRVSNQSTMRGLMRVNAPFLQAMERGEKFELENDYTQSLHEFQSASKLATSSSEKAKMLLRIARCHFKNNNFADAERVYQTIIDNPSMHFSSEALPPILIAYTQMAELMDRDRATQRRDSYHFDFYKLLLKQFHHVEQEAFDHYTQILKEKLTQGAEANTVWRERLQRLIDEENSIRKENEYSKEISKSILPFLQRHPPIDPEQIVLEVYQDSVTDRSRFIAYRALHRNDVPVKIIGCIYRGESFVRYVRDCFETHTLESNMKLTLLSNTTSTNAHADASFFSAELQKLQHIIPGYHVEFASLGSASIDAFTSTDRSAYYAVILAILALALGGTALLIRGVIHEQQITRMKSNFIANVSHEIKTPIATIRTLAENLHEGWISDREKQQEYFTLLARESERSSLLVSNILDFSRIEAGMNQYQFEVVSLQAIIDTVLERFHFLYDQKDIALEIKLSPNLPSVRVDARLMEQSILNLLDNAIKYTPAQKKIRLHVGMTEKMITLSIVDNGVGISRNEQKKIFRKFYRIDDHDGMKATGSGIGLSIVQDIIEAHGGTIDVESERGKGSAFIITLPIHNST